MPTSGYRAGPPHWLHLSFTQPAPGPGVLGGTDGRSQAMTGISRLNAPVAIKGPGVELRIREVGGDMTAAFVRVAGGTDLRPALKGLPGDLCQCPHWGYRS